MQQGRRPDGLVIVGVILCRGICGSGMCVVCGGLCVLCGSCLFGRHNVEQIEGDHTYLLRTTQPARIALHELHHGSTRGTKAEG
jgi:hypothetical protein